MKKFILITLFAIVSTCAFSQKTENVVGKWKFKDVYNKEKLDSNNSKMLKMLFGDLTMYFKSNGHYKAFLMKAETGTWHYDEATKKIVLTSSTGKTNDIDIISYKAESMTIKMGKATLVMEKIMPTESDEAEEPAKK